MFAPSTWRVTRSGRWRELLPATRPCRASTRHGHQPHPPPPRSAILVAFLALFVAPGLAIAAAAAIVDSPDDLGDRVVTERAMGFDSVSTASWS